MKRFKQILIAIVCVIFVVYAGNSTVYAANTAAKEKKIVSIVADYDGEVAEGCKISKRRLVIAAMYSDGSSALVTSGYKLSSYKIKEGKNTITVTYKGCKTKFKVKGVSIYNYVPVVENKQINIYTKEKFIGVDNLKAFPNSSILDTVDIKWSSSKSKVASVDSKGIIKGVSKGTTVIKAELLDTIVRFKVKVDIPADRIIMSNYKEMIFVGDTYKLSAKMFPGNATDYVKWSSSDKKVATVNSKGEVSGKYPGKAVITVTTGSGKSARCNVTVYNKVNTIKFSQSNYYMNKGDKIRLTYKVSPANSYVKLTWDSSSQAVASVDNKGNVTAKSSGTAYITVTTSTGKWATCVINVR